MAEQQSTSATTPALSQTIAIVPDEKQSTVDIDWHQQHRCQHKTPKDRSEERHANKCLRQHIRNVEEELAGRPKDFREKQIEKCKEQADCIYAAS